MRQLGLLFLLCLAAPLSVFAQPNCPPLQLQASNIGGDTHEVVITRDPTCNYGDWFYMCGNNFGDYYSFYLQPNPMSILCSMTCQFDNPNIRIHSRADGYPLLGEVGVGVPMGTGAIEELAPVNEGTSVKITWSGQSSRFRLDIIRTAGPGYTGETTSRALVGGSGTTTEILWNNTRTKFRLYYCERLVTERDFVPSHAQKKCDECCTGTPAQCAGHPVHTQSGNTQYEETDAIPTGGVLPFRRRYDSRSGVFYNLTGANWWSMFDSAVYVHAGYEAGRAGVTTYDEVGDTHFFLEPSAGSGTYVESGPVTAGSTTFLTRNAATGEWTHTDADKRLSRVYDSSGRIIRYVNNRLGRALEITWTSGYPSKVTDSWAAFYWDVTITGRNITSIRIDGRADREWTYSYSYGDLRLVSSPYGQWRSYEGGYYGLTRVFDTRNYVIESHSYTSWKRASNSYGMGKPNIDSIAYELPGRVAGERRTSITYSGGRIEDHYRRWVAGEWRTVEVHGGCASCGTTDAVVTYDDFGNVMRNQGADGYITESTFDATGRQLLQSRTALKPAGCDPSTDSNRCWQTPDNLPGVTLEATSETETTSYEYTDANWPERATAVVTASVHKPGDTRREEFVFDATSGTTLVQRTIGWTGTPATQQTRTTTTTLYDGATAAAFDPGTWYDRGWLTLVQPKGYRASIDGPRQDVTDTTLLVYYPIDATVPAVLRGQLAAVKNAAGHVTSVRDYDVFGNALRTIDANGVATAYTYDGMGRLLTTTIEGVNGCDTTADPLCGTALTETRSYLEAGLLHTIRHFGGTGTWFGSDNSIRPYSVNYGTWPGNLIDYQYYPVDSQSNQTSYLERGTREGGPWVAKTRTSYTYDSAARLAAETHLDGKTVTYAYDVSGRVKTVKDERHSSANTTYTYDIAGRVKTVTQTLGTGTVVTSYGYDGHGNLVSVTDPNGNTTTYDYDDFGQLLEQVSPVTGTTTYTYDPAGQLVSTTDANGATTTRTYDVLGRVTSSASTRGLNTETVTWTYDAGTFGLGRVSTMTDPTGTTAYTYERRGLLLSETKTIAGSNYVTRYNYDADGNRSKIVYPSGRVVTYTYDYARRPASVALGGVTIASGAKYVPFGPMSELTLGNGTRKTMTYDNRYRMTANQLATLGGATIASYGYGYDAGSNITSITDVQNATFNRTFGYDDLNRLVTANTGTSLWGAGSYTYDAMGNLLTSTLGTKAASFTYSGTTPKLASALESGTTRNVSYDTAGNEQYVGAETFTYSPRNHLATAGTFGYGYDGRGIRTTTQGLASERYSFYTPELNLLSETADTSANPKVIAHEYIWFAGQPIAQVDSTGAVSWYFDDHLGTPLLQTDSTATVVWRAEHEPYGVVSTFRAGSTKYQPLRFPGQEADGTERTYNIFRWYRPGWGRYSQADPLLRTAALVPYEYAGNAPVIGTDPLGLLHTLPPPRPGNIGTVFCDGNGGIEIQLDPRFTAQQYDCYAATCLVIHEQQHARDIMMVSGGTICQGQPRGTFFGYSSQREEDIYELRGNQAELDCLGNERCNASQPCRDLIDDRIRQLNANQIERWRRLGMLE